ncbi:hypothetical protein OSB04_001503 [Centaurea solstitialis]|uniref:Uncharacterized protein n=1 Tax=Centaurea solstitialis TaxID=347529 RepID=A0AA38WLT2_9ASTR|nr:hypothetical protein OSB04_001503 [Centaurea solstitialis]
MKHIAHDFHNFIYKFKNPSYTSSVSLLEINEQMHPLNRFPEHTFMLFNHDWSLLTEIHLAVLTSAPQRVARLYEK